MKILTLLITLVSLNAHAIFSTGESGEITPRNVYKVGLEPQFKLSDGGGTNFTGFFDMGISDSSSWRVNLGFGDTDFYAGGSYKWIPYPDFDNQPAMGLKFEGIYGRESNESLIGFRVHPLISKKFETDAGTFNPYASLPLGMVSFMGQSNFTANLVGGTEYKTRDLAKWGFGGEIGINLSKSFTYLMGFATYSFDNDRPAKRRK